MSDVLRLVVTGLCCVGFYASQHMYRKSLRSARGALDEPSIVEEPHARLFLGQPNALFGCIYFPLLAAGEWFYPLVHAEAPGSAFAIRCAALIALAAATLTSAFLAYSLLYITKRECSFCWAGHAVNLALLITVPWTLLP
jgi:uncharacterized membrane protein